MMKITKSSAQRLVEMYTNIHAQDRIEYVHVRDVETDQIVLEVNVYKRFAKIFIDYARDVYVYVRLPWDDAFILKEDVLLLSAEGIQTYSIFAMEVVE